MTDIKSEYLQASNPELNIWVSASAGSGKTKSLTDRFLRLLLEGVDPEKILCITFTKVAASEMLNRIKSILGQWTLLNDKDLSYAIYEITNINHSSEKLDLARGLFNLFLDRQDKLQIQTVHSFCQKMVNKFPIESGLNIEPVILTDHERDELLAEAKNNFLTSYETEFENNKFVSYLLENIHEFTLDSLLEEAIYISNACDFLSEKDRYVEKAIQALSLTPHTADSILKNLLEEIGCLIKNNKSLLQRDIDDEMNSIARACISFIDKDHQIEKLKKIFLTQDGDIRKSISSKKFAKLYTPELLNILSEIQNLVAEYSRKEIEIKTLKLTLGFLDLTYLFNLHFAKLKQEQGCLDYNDLINICLELLQNKEFSSWIEMKINTKILHVMVDEAQDINLKQWQIITACTEGFFSGNDKNSIFVVGDQKQSIYSFQGSSAELFEGIKVFFADRVRSAGAKLCEIEFSRSFRSDKVVLNFIDEVFSSITKKNKIYFCDNNLTHIAYKQFESASIEIWPLIIGNKQELTDSFEVMKSYQDTYDRRRALAEKIGDKIAELIKSGSFKPSDFMILVRKRDSLIDYLIRALKERKIPVSGLDRLRLNKNIAVRDIMSLIQFVLLPEDDYNLACLLKSPIFAISEDDLFLLSQRDQKTLWENLVFLSTSHTSFQSIFRRLRDILDNIGLHSPYKLAIYILDICGYRKSFVSRLGSYVNEILDEFLNITLMFEMDQNDSLLGFVHWFSNSDIEVKKEFSSIAEEVRIMTIHASKGLEARFVILPDTTTLPQNRDIILFDQLKDVILYKVPENQNENYINILESVKQRGLQEYYRLLYVALTRSSEHILICGHSSSAEKAHELSWYKIIKDVNAP